VLEDLQKRMMDHAERMEYEQAAGVRDQIGALSRVLHQQSVDTVMDKDVDVLAVKVAGGRACVNLAMVRGGVTWVTGRTSRCTCRMPSWPRTRSPTAHREAETAKAHRG